MRGLPPISTSAFRGATEPDSPITSVVTPWRILLWPLPSVISVMSEWLCRSMKPGATVRPLASMVRVAVPVTSPTAAIFPPLIAIDPLRGAPPLPSTIRALVISTSNDGAAAWRRRR